MGDERKVIPLNAKFKKQMVRTTPNDLRAAAAGTIALILFLMVGFNFSFFDSKRDQQAQISSRVQRSIASVPSVVEPQWQRSLTQLKKEMVTQTAPKPSAIDSLNFGLLEGKYSMQLRGGRITQISLAPLHNVEPKSLGDRLRFIQQYAVAFAPDFKSAEKMRIEKSDEGVKEVYKVVTSRGAQTFEFMIDDQDRLLSLDVK